MNRKSPTLQVRHISKRTEWKQTEVLRPNPSGRQQKPKQNESKKLSLFTRSNSRGDIRDAHLLEKIFREHQVHYVDGFSSGDLLVFWFS